MEYRIGSFNMKQFGANAKKDLAKIAEIIAEEDLDIVAFQEIFSEGKGIEKLLREFAENELYEWDFRVPDPSETKSFEPRGETYAYLWNKRKFKLIEFSKLGNKRVFYKIVTRNDAGIDCSVLARAPFYIRLQPRYGGFFELRLINIHIFYGDRTLSSVARRQAEFKILTEHIYPSINTKAYGQNRKAYTIAMGDYNLNIFSPYVQTEARNCYLPTDQTIQDGEGNIHVLTFQDGKKEIHIMTVQDQLSTLKSENCGDTSLCDVDKGYANNYDHFTYSPEWSPFVNVSFRTIDAVEKYCGGDYLYYRQNISDHLPIVMTVEI